MEVNNSQNGWWLLSDTVRLFITEKGGHMAPVEFDADSDNPIQPYYISPWQNEGLNDLKDPVLVPLRGDFFCLPFGNNMEGCNEGEFLTHGEAASSRWELEGCDADGVIKTLRLGLKTRIQAGKIIKKISLVEGQNVVYSSHLLEGYSGKMPLGHHCTLRVPKEEASLKVSVSEFDLGMTNPVPFGDPRKGEFQSLAIKEKFTDLNEVATLDPVQPIADCSAFPQREGFTDLLQIFKKSGESPAWTTATCQKEGYLWFSLKDASLLPSTVFWISNKGRHGAPWNGRNRCLGLEETCSYFAEGIAPSCAPNEINDAGFSTAVQFSEGQPTMINLIQGAIRIPDGFEQVKDIRFSKEEVTFVSITEVEISTVVDWSFLSRESF